MSALLAVSLKISREKVLISTANSNEMLNHRKYSLLQIHHTTHTELILVHIVSKHPVTDTVCKASRMLYKLVVRPGRMTRELPPFSPKSFQIDSLPSFAKFGRTAVCVTGAGAHGLQIEASFFKVNGDESWYIWRCFLFA